MERRLLTFVVASTAFFAVYMILLNTFGPPPQKLAEKEKEAAEQVEDKDGGKADAAQQPPTDDVERPDKPQPDEPKIEIVIPQSWITLGSMAKGSGYNMLVTATNLGGGIERIELTERNEDGSFKYRRVDVRHGYLGYFAGESAIKIAGVKVNVVGPGTPADVAGVQVGDIIVAIAGNAVMNRADIDRALLKTRPGDEVTVDVLRGDAAEPVAGQAEGNGIVAAGLPAPRGPPTVLTAKLTEHPLDLVRLARDGGDDQIAGNQDQLSCLMTLGQVNGQGITAGKTSIPGIKDPATLMWSQPDPGDNQPSGRDGPRPAEFFVDLSADEMSEIGGGALRLSRSYSLAPSSYAIDMSVSIENRSEKAQQLAYRLDGPNGLTLEGWWYSNKISPNFSGAAARDVVYKTVADGHELISGYALMKKAKKDPNDPAQTIFAPDGSEDSRILKYIAVDAQYFTVAYLPPAGGSSLTTFRRASADIVADADVIDPDQGRAVNSSFFLDSSIAEVGPGQSIRQDLRMFAGPKEPQVLADYGLADCIYYGWFAPFAKILASLLHVLSVVGYFPAIIILTVIVRACMFPLSRKAAVNAQRMQELAPELKKIAEQYKDDMEGRLKAQRELQQRVGFNPLAGCLPMFLQLPIFIGLYRALSVDIELRQEAVSKHTSWASNLAGPDMFYYWGDWLWEYLSGRGTGWLGPYFNILPVIVVVLFLAQQKMFMPPATDEQTAMTQKMMSIMTLMMGLFFFRVPAGLCVYFITSSLWGICERILVKKTLPSKPHFDTAVIDGTARPTEKKKETLAERIRQQVAKTEEPVERPHKRRRPPVKKKR